MDDVRPNDLNPEELLSAYLDGEVTAAERAQVEQMLASDPEARAALQELRALSAALQSLPKLSVGEDLSERVLRRAERAMLERQTLEPVAASAAEPVSLPPKTAVKQGETLLERGSHGAGWTRRLAWPLAAVAATLLIMLVNQKQKPELALAPVNVHKQAPRAGVSQDAVVQNAPAEMSREASVESSEESGSGSDFAAGNGQAGAVGEEDKRADHDRAAFDQPAKPSAAHSIEGAAVERDDRTAANSLSADMKAARSSAKGENDGQGRFGTTQKRQLQVPALAKAEHGGGGIGSAASPPAAPATSGAAVPGASLANSPMVDAKRARSESQAANARLELVVEVLGADGTAIEHSFDELLVKQNIRIDDFSELQQRKQIAQNQLPPGNEGAKDREVEAQEENGARVDAGADKQVKSLSQAKPGEEFNYRDQPQKEAEAKEQAKNAATADLNAGTTPSTKPAEPVVTRGNKKGLGTAKPEKAPAAAGLAAKDEDHLAKPSAEEPAAEAGENFGITGETVSPSSQVEVVLVTATPAQVRGLLQEMENRADQYRALPVEPATGRRLAEDTQQPKGAAQLESLAANRAVKAGPPNAPVAPAGKVKSQTQAPDEASSSYAVRWRVSEEQLASLMKDQSLDQIAGLDHLEGAASGILADGIVRGGSKRETDMLTEQAASSELADAPADATLRDGADEGAARKAPVEKTQAASQPEPTPAPAASAAPQKASEKLKAPLRGDGLGGQDENDSQADKEVAEKVGASPVPAENGIATLHNAPAFWRQQRAELEKQLRGTAEDQQIRVLFVLRGGAPSGARNKADVAGQSSSPAGEPNATVPAAPAESAPSEAPPAKE